MRVGVRIAVAIVAVSLLRAIPTAQNAGGQQPTFRSHTEHVALDVVVTGKDDRPITDLTSADFTLSEQGRPQTIADFRFVSIPPAARPIRLTDPPPPPFDVGANGQLPQASRAVAFVFDMTLNVSDIGPWKRELTNFLDKMSPDDQMAVVYTGRSDLGQDFTNDPGRLVRAINNLPAAMFAAPAGFMSETRPGVARHTTGQTVCGGDAGPRRCMLIVLDNVVKTLAAAHQTRRFIVLASQVGCVPVGNPIIGPMCRDVIAHSRRADVPIYAIAPPSSVSFQPPDDMRVLAEQTGGRAFLNTAEVTATTTILADNGSYYVLGFYPDPLVSDGTFHEVKVTVNRPGAHVRARAGYDAPPASAQAVTPERAMAASLAAGVDDPRLPLRAVATPIAASGHGMRVLITIELTYPTSPGRSQIDDDLRLGLLGFDSDAHVRAQSQRSLRFSATSSQAGAAALTVDDVIDLPSGPLTLRVGVSSRQLGTTGTLHLPLDVPNPSSGDVRLSGVAIGLSGVRPTAVLGAGARTGLVPFQPTTVRAFGSTDTLRVFARAFWGGKDPTAGATVSIDGTVVLRGLTISGGAAKSGRHEGAIDAIVPLQHVLAGAHVLTVEAHLGNRRSARREVPFTIR
ncbi:MAG: VWA domain-containing protein [Vicinamibacterales bacterium]